MATVCPSVRAAWGRNLEVNRALVRHLEPDMVHARTPGGGFTVAQHLAEIVGTHKHWAERLDPARLGALPDLFEPGNQDFVAETDLARILEVMERTAAVALEAAEAHPDGAPELPHENADAYLVHMMVHDAHHRGQIMLALKTNGHARPDDEVIWGPWRS